MRGAICGSACYLPQMRPAICRRRSAKAICAQRRLVGRRRVKADYTRMYCAPGESFCGLSAICAWRGYYSGGIYSKAICASICGVSAKRPAAKADTPSRGASAIGAAPRCPKDRRYAFGEAAIFCLLCVETCAVLESRISIPALILTSNPLAPLAKN